VLSKRTATPLPGPTSTPAVEEQATESLYPPSPIPTATFSPSVSLRAGETISFGEYEWEVLKVVDNQALIITKDIIEKRVYNKISGKVTWETSTLRAYLNGDFYDYAFSEEEKASIVSAAIENRNNQWYNSAGGNDTEDKVFLLSLEEVVKYFGDSKQLRNRNPDSTFWINDEFNSERIAKDLSGSAAPWWLRSPGNDTALVVYVADNGWVRVFGWSGHDRYFGVRPALWLKL